MKFLPDWHKDAIIYEVPIKSFYDSNSDGIGDFKGLLLKLDYIQDLGINCIWLMPFYSSPLKDDGYDVSGYRSIHPQFGNMDDFKAFIAETSRREIKVIIDLVLNHTSDQHPWFQQARDPESPYHNYYVWSDDPNKYSEARIIFKDFEKSNWAWDEKAKKYYWHRFFSHQPDLNFENEQVQKEMLDVLKYWLNFGIAGFRLDAIPNLFEKEGTPCENLPETHLYLQKLRTEMDKKFPNRIFLAEANLPPDLVTTYFGNGDECHMAFHFPLMPRIFMSLRKETRLPIEHTLKSLPIIPDSCQWALFLRNHDELTLETVTEEERSYMLKEFASENPKAVLNLGIKRRLAPLLHNGRRQIELCHALLLSLPGTPVLYYGDELGMGDNLELPDRHSVRTPMQWNHDRNAGFSEADPDHLYFPVINTTAYGFSSLNVEAQTKNPTSLLNWLRRMIRIRQKSKVFGRGSMRVLLPENVKVLAFIREYEGEQVLVVSNLSRYVQPVELDLSDYAGKIPVEMIGGAEFPKIETKPYFFSLGPHNFIWFSLK